MGCDRSVLTSHVPLKHALETIMPTVSAYPGTAISDREWIIHFLSPP